MVHISRIGKVLSKRLISLRSKILSHLRNWYKPDHRFERNTIRKPAGDGCLYQLDMVVLVSNRPLPGAPDAFSRPVVYEAGHRGTTGGEGRKTVPAHRGVRHRGEPANRSPDSIQLSCPPTIP